MQVEFIITDDGGKVVKEELNHEALTALFQAESIKLRIEVSNGSWSSKCVQVESSQLDFFGSAPVLKVWVQESKASNGVHFGKSEFFAYG